jgi:hypothetical protein
MGKWIILIANILLIAACATSQPMPATAAAATQGQQESVVTGAPMSGQKLICTESYPTGSHLPQRVCMTQAQIEARRKADQDTIRNMQNQQSPTLQPPPL